MRYLILIILLFIFSKPIRSQEDRKLIDGKIKLNSFPIHDVHIINMTANTGSISNDLGILKIHSCAIVKLDNRFGKTNGDDKRAISLKKLITENQPLVKNKKLFKR